MLQCSIMNEPSNQLVMDSTDERIAAAEFAISANLFELMSLRDQFKKRIVWNEHYNPLLAQIGEYNGQPINCLFTFVSLRGRLVVFYEIKSDVWPRAQVQQWFRDNGVSRHATAINFHHVIMHITSGKGLLCL